MKNTLFILLLITCCLCGKDVISQTATFPNVITPNNDGHNDEFFVTSSGYVKMETVIFNRRGETIINLFGLNSRWDGRTSSGERVMDGVYFYKITMTREDGEVETFMGNIQVLGRE